MRRVVLLALLALALPAVALADSIDFEGFADSTHPATVNGSVSSGGSLSLTFNELSVNGAAVGGGSVAISLNFNKTACGTGCFDIASGTITVTNASNTVIFTGTFSGGSATETGNMISVNGATTGGVTVVGLITSKGVWVGSSETVASVPEPGTLGLLGTGLIGLAGLARRKFIN